MPCRPTLRSLARGRAGELRTTFEPAARDAVVGWAMHEVELVRHVPLRMLFATDVLYSMQQIEPRDVYTGSQLPKIKNMNRINNFILMEENPINCR